ncbi:MAG: oxygen-independent coproporphyrinogen III oxidase [Magnetococcales bacterium]|nr:oxygen-independent coproporphyrinogen III oxidase [Magnetococcales bacterium]
MSQQVLFDRRLIDRYNRAGPRYTSYPTAPHFHQGFGPEAYLREITRSLEEQPDKPLSLYVHIPFCDTVCYYCACNRTVTPDRTRAAVYLEHLLREVALAGRLFGTRREVVQLHFGGGTPTYLDAGQLTRLMETIRQHFRLAGDETGEFGIEVDPREMPPGLVHTLRHIGFNRLSIGVQDLDEQVQRAVNRIQPLELTAHVVEEARSCGFGSINLDLIYGLPFQTLARFRHTLETVIGQLRPDRLAMFNYAHLPEYFSPQRKINPQDLPAADEKLAILEMAITVLTQAGYVYIGMDHFALPQDELAVAQRQGELHRNFQGYTTHAGCDLVGLGTTAISQIGDSYAQNLKEIPAYYQRIEEGKVAVFRGLAMTPDDVVRRTVIMRLLCDFRLDRSRIEERFGLVFEDYFHKEMEAVGRMIAEGLLTEEGPILQVTPGGRLLIRNICMAFDWYLGNMEQKKSFSKTI